jgi:ADP-heptose:LPS heptosyltransferase
LSIPRRTGWLKQSRRWVEEATGTRLEYFDEVDYFKDLEEVLAILEACDLVITTSNATAHLAGVLGKRTWLLYPADRAPFHYWRTAAATAPSGILRWRSSRRPSSKSGRR